MSPWKYDVFVSFRGEDVRKNFIDHLFNAFKQYGIRAFTDCNDLPRGEDMSCQFYKAIEKSRFLMVIFSRNYASSSWCMRELVKILNCSQKEKPKHEIRIIFYDVKPEVVRNQIGSFAEAFAKHQVSNREEIDEWKAALSMASDLSGWDLNDMTNGFESKFIDRISRDIHKTLCDGPMHVGENLVGVNTRVIKLNLMRFVGSAKVNMIGIYGISGIGKTTLAKAIYNKMYAYFEGSCFCEDVAKRHDPTQVQMQLINKIMKNEDVKILGKSEGVEAIKKRLACEPILLVLDDVDHRDQIEALAGSHDWFCPGSLIIFTSKDKQLLRSHGVEIYEMELLDALEDTKLFCLNAFGQTHPTHDFKELTCQVVKYLQGHPLALKVAGSALFKKSECVWKSKLKSLRMCLDLEIHQKLRPSYDLLNFDQKRIFLDIACSFVGENKDLSASVLDDICCFPDVNIDVLVDRSLITISPYDFSLQMHELIRSMAREVIREESDRPIRLWGPSEIDAVLGKNNVTLKANEVEVLVLLLENFTKTVHINCKAFAKMEKLRILKIFHPEQEDLGQPFQYINILADFKVNFLGSLDFLSNDLKLIYWHGYPFKFLPSSFYPKNIVAIDLSYSNITSFWTKPECFTRLKVMKLRHCRNLTAVPDFTSMTNLENLVLEGCVNLVRLHPSVGKLKKLVTLNMRDCRKMRNFPSEVEMDSLEILILSGCVNLGNLTHVKGTLKSLVKLYADETAITEFPSFISSSTDLQVLVIGKYQQIGYSTWWTSIFQKQPQSLVSSSLASFRMLTTLSVRNCNISEVCLDIKALLCLRELDLSGNIFTSLPLSLSKLLNLRLLQLTGCKKLNVLPELPPNIEDLHAFECISLIQDPPLDHPHPSLYCYLTGCQIMFGNQNTDRQRLSMSGTTDHLSFCLEYLCIRDKVRKFFSGNGSSSKSKKKMGIIVNGNRIPEWFTNKTRTSSSHDVKVELPPNWCNSKFRGFGICVVFKPTMRSQRELLGYSVKNFDGVFIDGVPPIYSTGDDEVNIMTWLHFKTCNSEWKEAKNFVTFSFRDEDIELKECSVRLICDQQQDLKEEQETVLDIIQQLPPQSLYTGLFRLLDGFNVIDFTW
uniref:disease resistance protein RPV1-like n=1 Tax=Erigeron canadensis TaxID=72917 RepID=UPI001CB8BC9E|nr:disease resistance protein RPV1-like [Erigeron canadensis]